MKSVLSKIVAMVAMLITLLSVALAVLSLVMAFLESLSPIENEFGISRSFAMWIYSAIIAAFSLIFYFIDAIFSAIKVSLKINPVFNTVLTLVLLGAIPMCLFFGGGLSPLLWNIYYVGMFILELVSIALHCAKTKEPDPDIIEQ